MKNFTFKFFAPLLFSLVAVSHGQSTTLFAQDVFSENLTPIVTMISGDYEARIYPISEELKAYMMGRSYKEGCPIPWTDLAYVQVTHYDMKGNLSLGELVVHQKVARAVIEVFEEIFLHKFPIEKMRLIDAYGANDDLSMEDNNSSAFCFRDIVNKPGFISKHGLGLAIDINPLWNPYVKGEMIAPASAAKYVDRTLEHPGILQSDGVVVQAFAKKGFTWGGNWMPIKGYVDFQHFEMDPSLIGM